MCTVCDAEIEVENKLFDSISERLNGFVDKLATLNQQPKRFSKSYFRALTDFFLSGVQRQPPVEVAYNAVNAVKQSYMEANIFRFSAAKSVSMVTDLNKLLRAQQRSSDFREFKKGVDQLKLNYNKHWLETEYRLTQSVSRNSARHSQFMSELDVYQYVRYKTVNDARVRDWHRVLHNRVVKINSPEYDLISPPNGFRCRCEFVQIKPTLEELQGMGNEGDLVQLLSAEPVSKTKSAYQYMQENGFDKNRAKSSVIFDENRFYIKSFNEAGLSYKDYGLESYQQFKQANPQIRNEAAETETIKRDYRGSFIETNFFAYHPATLQRPDEVWLVFQEENNSYVKKYILHNEVITVNLTPSREQVMLVESLADAAINKIRRGVLVHGNR